LEQERKSELLGAWVRVWVWDSVFGGWLMCLFLGVGIVERLGILATIFKDYQLSILQLQQVELLVSTTCTFILPCAAI
jgi:hypothetical protein